MNVRLWTLACVAAWTVAVLLSQPLVADEPSAGWDRFEFVGNTAFSDEQLRTALIAEPDFLLAAHPQSDRSMMKQVAERLLIAGYRNSGFKSPQVAFQATDNGGGIITIDEGPRFRCGPIQICGATQISIDRLTERLTQPSAKDDSFPTFVELNGETVTRWVDSKGKSVELEKPVWQLDSDVKFDTEVSLSKKVVAALKDLGFSSGKPQVTIKSNDTESTAELIVDILEEGPSDVAQVFHVEGTQTNSPNAVLEFLELTPGVEVNQTLVQSITKRLWDCGRFKKHNVYFDRDEDGRGRLNIELTDVKGVPSLTQPLSEAAVVFMRARRWLTSVNDRNEDVSITFRNNGLTLEVVQSQQGLLLQLCNSNVASGALASHPHINLSLVFDDSFVTVANSQNATLWQADIGQFDGKFRLETNVAVAEEDEKFSRLNLTGNCNSRRSKTEAPFLSTLNVSPADWSGFAYKAELQSHVADGRLYVTGGKESLEVDVATGQIYRWDSEFAEMRIAVSRFSGLKSQIASQCHGKKNDYEASRPVSTLATHLFSPQNWEVICELWQLQFAGRKPLEPSLASAFVKLIDGEMFRPLDAFAIHTANDRGPDQFEIPYSAPSNLDFTRIAMQLVGKYGLKCAPQIFEEGTWPMSVTREACLVMVDRGKYSGAVLKELQSVASNGPPCDASVAYLLALAKQPVASAFAKRSLDRLNPASFQSDREILMSGPSGKWMASVIAACESLSTDEIESLRAIGLNDRVVTGLYAIQKQGESNEDNYWYQIAKHGLEGMLGGIVQR